MKEIKNSDDPNQTYLADAKPEKIPAIEKIVKEVVEKKSQRAALKERVDELHGELVPLFHEHGLTAYQCHGYRVSIEPGADIVRIKKAKQK